MIAAAPRSSARSAPGLAMAVLLLSACSHLGLGGRAEVVSDPRLSDFERGVEMLATGAFAAAETVLRDVASLCTSGADGRRAILLLSSLRLDPRNPDVRPDSAALHALRYLSLLDADPAERPLATSLYLMAVDQGASPSLRPVAGDAPGSISHRFSSCELPAEPIAFASPPLLMREPRALAQAGILAQRDSLSRRTVQLEESNEAMQQRIREMETELQRIRRLLGVPPGRPPGLEPR